MQALNFDNIVGVTQNTLVTSNIITITESFTGTLSVGTFILNGTAVGNTVSVVAGDTLAIRTTSSPLERGVVRCLITVLNNYYVFRVQTKQLTSFDLKEESFVLFTADTYPDVTITSNTNTVTNVNAPLNVSVDNIYGATLLINNVNINSTESICNIGDTVAIQFTTRSASFFDHQYVIGMFFGESYDEWVVNISNLGSVPIPLQFEPIHDVELNTIVTSNIQTIFGISSSNTLSASVNIGTIIKNNTDVGQSCSLNLGDTVALRVVSDTKSVTSTFVILDLGVAKYAFGIITKQTEFVNNVLATYKCSNFLNYNYVPSADSSTNKISVYNTISHAITIIDANITNNVEPYLLRDYVAAVDYYANRVILIDSTTNTIVRTLTIVKPTSVGYSTGNRAYRSSTIYVANGNTNRINILSPVDLSVRPEYYQCTSIPYSISCGIPNIILVSQIDANSVLVLDSVNYTLSLKQTLLFPIGSKPGHIHVSGNYAYIPLTCSNIVAIINLSDFSVQTLIVGNNPTSIASDSAYIYVSNSSDNTIARITKSSHAILSIDTISYCTEITFCNGNVYSGAFQTDTIRKYDTLLNELDYFDFLNSCYGLASANNNVYVVSYYSNTPNVITEVTDLSVPIDTLHSSLGAVDTNVNDISNTILVPTARFTRIEVPSNFYSALINVVNGVSSNSVKSKSPENIFLTAKHDIDAVDTYIPVLSPGNSKLYKVTATIPDYTIDPFYFDTTVDAYVRHWYYSNSITISGLQSGLSVSFTVSTHLPLIKDPGFGISPSDFALTTKNASIVKNGITLNSLTTKVKNGDLISLKYYTIRYYSRFTYLQVNAANYTTYWYIYNLVIIGSDSFAKERSTFPIENAITFFVQNGFHYQSLVSQYLYVKPNAFGRVNNNNYSLIKWNPVSRIDNNNYSFIKSKVSIVQNSGYLYVKPNAFGIVNNNNYSLIKWNPVSRIDNNNYSLIKWNPVSKLQSVYSFIKWNPVSRIDNNNYSLIKWNPTSKVNAIHTLMRFDVFSKVSVQYISQLSKIVRKELMVYTYQHYTDAFKVTPTHITVRRNETLFQQSASILYIKTVLASGTYGTIFDPFILFESQPLTYNKHLYDTFIFNIQTYETSFSVVSQDYTIPYTYSKFEITYTSNIHYANIWFECFDTCNDLGLFDTVEDALTDALAHGNKYSEIFLYRKYGLCWAWDKLTPLLRKDSSKIGGYIHGG